MGLINKIDLLQNVKSKSLKFVTEYHKDALNAYTSDWVLIATVRLIYTPEKLGGSDQDRI